MRYAVRVREEEGLCSDLPPWPTWPWSRGGDHPSHTAPAGALRILRKAQGARSVTCGRLRWEGHFVGCPFCWSGHPEAATELAGAHVSCGSWKPLC